MLTVALLVGRWGADVLGPQRTPGSPETRLHALFAVLGTDLGTEPGELDANKRDVMKQAGRRNAVDLDI